MSVPPVPPTSEPSPRSEWSPTTWLGALAVTVFGGLIVWGIASMLAHVSLTWH